MHCEVWPGVSCFGGVQYGLDYCAVGFSGTVGTALFRGGFAIGFAFMFAFWGRGCKGFRV